ncbi:ADP-ribosylglycohydrolase family protein [Streptomyces sp. NBC_00663]|uniref:ADP-ribosylglycohydrolase family protein n=1 Tax=Streptomyces sp. NBC_00663 TaxID=2975801 RepID=UPI002E306B70|nr:ADP-ribosylglycohydrolase family protein [Streptomyces sp. NBC_00663]
MDVLALELETAVVDAVSAGYRIWRSVFTARGKLLTSDDWAGVLARSVSSGSSVGVVARDLLSSRGGCRDSGLQGREELDAVAATAYEPLIRQGTAQDGVREWLRQAARIGMRCVAFSVTCPALVEESLHRLGWGELVVPGDFDEVLAMAPGRRGADIRRRPSPVTLVSGSPWLIELFHERGARCLAVANKFSSYLVEPGPGVTLVQPRFMSLPAALDSLYDSDTGLGGTTAPQRERLWGSLAGLALGDSVGKLVDKRPASRLDRETEELLADLTSGREPPAGFTGRVTDETALLFASLDVLRAHRRMSRDAFEAMLRRINPLGGRQVYKLRARRDLFSVADDGVTNGCISRCVPLAYLYGPESCGDLASEVHKLVSVTHFSPDSMMAALVFTLLLSGLLRGEAPDVALELPFRVAEHLRRLARGGDAVLEALHAAALVPGDRRPADVVDQIEDEFGMAVEARSSVIAAIALAVADHPMATTTGLLLRRRGSWDLDSTAAIYLALAGAVRPAEVPAKWVSRIEARTARNLAVEARMVDAVRTETINAGA